MSMHQAMLPITFVIVVIGTRPFNAFTMAQAVLPLAGIGRICAREGAQPVLLIILPPAGIRAGAIGVRVRALAAAFAFLPLARVSPTRRVRVGAVAMALEFPVSLSNVHVITLYMDLNLQNAGRCPIIQKLPNYFARRLLFKTYCPLTDGHGNHDGN